MSFGHVLLGFKGRIDRKTYWMAVLALMVLGVVAKVLPRAGGDDALALRLLAGGLSLVTLYSALAVGAKRWHDRDKSAWWVLLGFVPLVGQIWTLVECGFLPGTAVTNRFGPGGSADVGLAPRPAVEAAIR